MHFGLTHRQRQWLHRITITSSLTSWAMFHAGDGVPSWLFYTLLGVAFTSGITSMAMRRFLRVESNVASVTIDSEHMHVQLIDIGRMDVVLADLRDIRCLSPQSSAINKLFTRVQGHIVRIGYRDRKRKVLYAQIDLQTSAVWMPDLIAYLLDHVSVPWYIDSQRCDDPAAILAWLHAARATPTTGNDPRATLLHNSTNTL